MLSIATVTSKGQITIPKEIREHLKLKKGHRVTFWVDREGRVIVSPRNGDVRELKGIIHSRRRRPPTIREINEAIARGYAGR